MIAASSRGNVQLIELLVSKGADVNHETEAKDTPLSLAVFKNHPAAAIALMDLNASPLHVDKVLLLFSSLLFSSLLVSSILSHKHQLAPVLFLFGLVLFCQL